MAFITETRVNRQPAESHQKRLIVAIRIRPLKPLETTRGLHSVNDKVVVLEEVEVDNRDVLRQNRGSDRQFVFDHVFDEGASQSRVYDLTTASLVQDVMHGYNATIFAYGPTGTGKTHTMLGTPSDPGIMVRALNDLFEFVKKDTEPETINVSMSYIEIYNENVRDLLNPKNGYLELREDNKDKTIHVVGLAEVSTSSTNEVMQLLTRGNKARTMESTAANKTSSRSHALLSVTVRRALHSGPVSKLRARVRQGKLFMIDLAGSERASATQNRGRRLVEGGHINRSLLALGNCINALSGGARYVNYRDSKLTRLLKDALSGNCRTCMIAHVSPSNAQREESKNTLLYADRARSITNKVGQNVLDISYHVSQYRNIISELRDEISRLKTKMVEKTDDKMAEDDVPLLPVQINQLPRDIKGNRALDKMLTNTDQLRTLKTEIVAIFKEQMKLRKKMLNIESYQLSLQMEHERQQSLIAEWEARNNKLYRPGAPNERLGDSTDLTAHKAWEDLQHIEQEQEKYADLRMTAQRQLDDCKARADQLEKSLPPTISTEEERELLRLMIRCHELEVEKIELQSERIIKLHELQQRDMAILRYDRQRQICEEIITRQRQIMEEGRISLPADLQALYQLYQQELHASSHNEMAELAEIPLIRKGTGKFRKAESSARLPPISTELYPRGLKGASLDNGLDDSDSTTPSSAGSDWPRSPLPAVATPATPGLPPAHVLFPPLSRSFQDIRSNLANQASRIPRPSPPPY